MKSAVVVIAIAASAWAHSIFQKVSVNGADQGLLVGLRAPQSDYPVYDVNDQQLTCGLPGTRSDKVIDVKAGDRIGAWWGHVIGGEQYPSDPDHPIAASHKGPISTYMARVDNAATASDAGLQWFKIHEDTFDPATGLWGVDNMIANSGWSFPHGAQFYQSCAQLNVSGSGTYLPSEMVSIPGAYNQDDPGILIQIWVNGIPDNGGKPYTAPGPRPMMCLA
ncbi:hypothetical protein VTH82DRAFT_1369 [Thermothelomyces myriococcoides]